MFSGALPDDLNTWERGVTPQTSDIPANPLISHIKWRYATIQYVYKQPFYRDHQDAAP
jgi:hypothetical protein